MAKTKKEQKTKKKTIKKRKTGALRLWLTALTFLFSLVLTVSIFIFPFFFQQVRSLFSFIVLGLFLLDVVIGIFIANSAVQVDFKVSWLTVILILPIAGPLFYLIFAQKETKTSHLKKRLAESENYIEMGTSESDIALAELADKDTKGYLIANSINKNTTYATYKNSKFEYFKLGEIGFPKVVEELKKAKRFVFFEFFIIEHGIFFDTIYEILKEKAKEGVEVRFIYDDFGSSAKISSQFYMEARKDGIKCFPFNRMRPAMDFRQNSRDHRKIIIIDGVVAFSGGCNIADEYINKNPRFGVWKDNIFMVKGKAVDGYTNIFLQSWNKTCNDLIDDSDSRKYFFGANKDLIKGERIKSDGYLTPYGEVPFDNETTTRDVWLSIINNAKDYVLISSPYLVPDSEVLTALETKAKSGVRVCVITPGIPDKKIIFSVTRSYYARLIMAGVEVYEYTPGFNHAKVIVSDDDICSVGTANLDYRSLYLHYECSLLVSDSKEIFKVRDDLLEMIEASTLQHISKYIKAKFIVKIYWALLRIMAPLF